MPPRDDRQRDAALLALMEALIRSNVDLAEEVRKLRKAIQQAAGGNLVAGMLSTLGLRGGRR